MASQYARITGVAKKRGGGDTRGQVPPPRWSKSKQKLGDWSKPLHSLPMTLAPCLRNTGYPLQKCLVVSCGKCPEIPHATGAHVKANMRSDRIVRFYSSNERPQELFGYQTWRKLLEKWHIWNTIMQKEDIFTFKNAHDKAGSSPYSVPADVVTYGHIIVRGADMFWSPGTR